MGEGLLSLLFYCESDINQYAGEKTLRNNFGASVLLIEVGYFTNIVVPYHLRMLHVVMTR